MAPPSLWEMEKQQLCAQLALLGQQLQAETTARMEAQVTGGGMAMLPRVTEAWLQCVREM